MEWKNYLSVTDAISILPIEKPSFFPSATEIFLKYIGEIEIKISETDKMLYGKCIEKAIDEYLYKKYHWELEPAIFRYHQSLPLGGAVDRILFKKKIIFEYKNLFSPETPEYVEAQLRLYLDIWNYTTGIIVISHQGSAPELIVIQHDPTIIEEYSTAIQDFWTRVQKARKLKEEGQPIPEILFPIEEENNKRKIPRNILQIENQCLISKLHKWKKIKDQLKQLQQEIEELENEFRNLAENEDISTEIADIHYPWCYPKKKRVDSNRLAVEYPEVYEAVSYLPEKYRRLSIIWKENTNGEK
jgi:calcineurin-like phosphoesterase family protein